MNNPWQIVDFYRQFHPRWFESVDRYEPTDEHHSVYRDVFAGTDWTIRREGMWYVADPPSSQIPDQGWKLHLSARTARSVDILRRTLPILREESVSFKFLLDQSTTALVNSKTFTRGSAGKFVTIYPPTLDQFYSVGQILAEQLQDFVGPYILSDRRWPRSRCLFYRYGGFVAQPLLQIDGTRKLVIDTPDGGNISDERNPFWSPPAWATDPWGIATHSPSASASYSLCNGRFNVQSAISFSNRGGVYLATDQEDGRQVVLKEARPNVEIGQQRIDSIEILNKEYRLLELLADTGHFVRPIALFYEWEHAFLAQQFLPGDHLGRFTTHNNPLYWGDYRASSFLEYYEKMRQLWLQLAEAIKIAHQRQIVLCDLSFSNVRIEISEKVRIIDLEAAVELGIDPTVGLHTLGVSGLRTSHLGLDHPLDDYASLGSLILGSVMLVPGFLALHPPSRGIFLRELKNDLQLADEFLEVVDELSLSETCANAQAAAARIAYVPIMKVASAVKTDAGAVSSEKRASLRDAVANTLSGILEYVERTATLDREDRLFPADLAIFRTNPMSISHGASGVVYAVSRIRGDVPPTFRKWLRRKAVTNRNLPPGLYIGQSGVAWVLSELGDLDLAFEMMRELRNHPLLHASPNMMHGLSGYGMACLRMWFRDGGDEFLDDATRVGDNLLRSAMYEERGAYWPENDGSVPLGYAFGASGIALFLLYLYVATLDRSYLDVGRLGLDFELSQAAIREGRLVGFPAEMPDDSKSPTVLKSYWDVGSAGVATTVVRYLRLSPEPELAAWVTRLESDISRKYVAFPQLFHGLAGLGNSLLDIWEHGGRERSLEEAWKVAAGVLLFRMEREEGVVFPGEQAIRESADFATGSSGIGLFFQRLLQADVGRKFGNFNFVIDELFSPDRDGLQATPALPPK